MLDSLNNSRYFAGLCMIILNIGSRYVQLGLSHGMEDIIRTVISRQLLIFSIAWMGTRDVITSIILTACFIVLSDHLLNEKSSYCILPKHKKDLYHAIDLNKDNKISKDEIERAIQIIQKANT